MPKRCPRCSAEVSDEALECPKCGSPLPMPVEDKTLREAVKFAFIAPLYSKPKLVYDSEGLLVGVETEFRLFKALREQKQPSLVIYDEDGYVNPKRHEYALVKPDPDVVLKIARSTPEKVLSKIVSAYNLGSGEDEERKHPAVVLWEIGALVTPVPRLKNVEFLKNMKWRDFVDELVDFKKVGVDPRLKLIRLTHLMRGFRQAVNPHALIVLPGQTGKSEWYKAVGVCEDKVSANSLIGYADADGPKPGSIDGSELPFALDQIESSGMYTIFRYMLGLMETGEARVDMAAYPFDIRSLSPFAILSNPVGEVKGNFAVLLEKLSKNPALGRRFGIILYDKNAVRIRCREKDMDVLQEKVALFRAVEEYCLPEIRKILNNEKVWSWLNARNEEFVKQALKAVEAIEGEDENLHLFLKEFVENGGAHTRGGALRAALALNLDKIALKEYNVDDLLQEAEEILSDLLKINYDSILLIAVTFQETKEEGDRRAFDTLPTYMKEIVSAVELWRRSLSEENRRQLAVPLTFYLDTLEYAPQTKTYFSEILSDARKGNPEKYNEMLKSHFQFELKKDGRELQAVVFSLAPLPHLQVLGKLGNLGNFENFGGATSPEQKQGQAANNNMPPQNLQNFPKFPKFPKALDCAGLKRLSGKIVGRCEACGFSGRMAWQADLKDGGWILLCEACGSRLESEMGGGA